MYETFIKYRDRAEDYIKKFNKKADEAKTDEDRIEAERKLEYWRGCHDAYSLVVKNYENQNEA